jgi:hypothetical protein
MIAMVQIWNWSCLSEIKQHKVTKKHPGKGNVGRQIVIIISTDFEIFSSKIVFYDGHRVFVCSLSFKQT